MTFRFTIADAAVFLGKSPATIRNWERKGLLRLPRDGGKRLLTVADLRAVAKLAYDRDRISLERFWLICDATAVLQDLEKGIE